MIYFRMDKNIIAKLVDILEYYKNTYSVGEDINLVLDELIENNVEVNGDSFYCPIWSDEFKAWVLLAGTKDKADMWVLKKIIKLIKSGEPIYTMFNGNSDYLLERFKRYNVHLISRNNDVSYISFNKKDN